MQNSQREPHALCKCTNKLRILCRRPFRNSLVALLIFLGVGPALYGAIIWEQGNFHVVSNGRVYRSRQLNRDELARYAHDYGIKSVLNLRGRNLGAGWYQEEILAVQSLGFRHYDYALSADRDVGDHDIERILDIIREAPKPILIHCKSGADRTSLIAALYLYQLECKTADESERQLSLRYGHFPYLESSTQAMDRTFQRYVRSHATCAIP